MFRQRMLSEHSDSVVCSNYSCNWCKMQILLHPPQRSNHETTGAITNNGTIFGKPSYEPPNVWHNINILVYLCACIARGSLGVQSLIKSLPQKSLMEIELIPAQCSSALAQPKSEQKKRKQKSPRTR